MVSRSAVSTSTQEGTPCGYVRGSVMSLLDGAVVEVAVPITVNARPGVRREHVISLVGGRDVDRGAVSQSALERR
ncbi:hypothetical protein GCM10009625_00830 [Brachybacterium fresconis]